MWISQVKNGGVAYRSGLVERGDGLLAINGVPVGTSTLSEAAGMLRDSTDIVVLQIRKKERQAELDDNVEFTVELMRRGRSLGITLNGECSIAVLCDDLVRYVVTTLSRLASADECTASSLCTSTLFVCYKVSLSFLYHWYHQLKCCGCLCPCIVRFS